MAEVRQAIIVGRFRSGELLSEQTIAEQLQISRTPVREALLQLRAEGLVEFVPNRGVRVIEPSAEHLGQVFQFRAAVEGYCARVLARQPTRDGIVRELEAALEEQERIIAADDHISWVVANMRFHLLIVERAGNQLMIETVRNLASHTMRIGYQINERTRDRRRQSIAEHTAIVEAIRDGQPEKARKSAEEHMTITTSLMHRQMAEESAASLSAREA